MLLTQRQKDEGLIPSALNIRTFSLKPRKYTQFRVDFVPNIHTYSL